LQDGGWIPGQGGRAVGVDNDLFDELPQKLPPQIKVRRQHVGLETFHPCAESLGIVAQQRQRGPFFNLVKFSLKPVENLLTVLEVFYKAPWISAREYRTLDVSHFFLTPSICLASACRLRSNSSVSDSANSLKAWMNFLISSSVRSV